MSEKRFKPSDKIKSAAILYNGSIYVGYSHNTIGLEMLEKRVCPRPYPSGAAQGFVTEGGDFVDRKKAIDIATEFGQIVEKQGNPNELYSEDLRERKKL